MDSISLTSILETLQSTFAWNIGIFVHLATLGYVLGFLFKNQIILRVLVLIATVSYIVYYYAFPAEPLWGAIFGSILIMIANLIGTTRLLYDHIPFGVKDGHKKIFESLKGLTPGEYRRLMKAADIRVAGKEVTLTQEGKEPDYLYYILEGDCEVQKGNETFTLAPNQFVGEASFILGGEASATVIMPKSGVYAKWERDTLLKTLDNNPELKYAFEALIGRDMAHKVAVSHPTALSPNDKKANSTSSNFSVNHSLVAST